MRDLGSIMEKKMQTTIGLRGLGTRVAGLQFWVQALRVGV